MQMRDSTKASGVWSEVVLLLGRKDPVSTLTPTLTLEWVPVPPLVYHIDFHVVTSEGRLLVGTCGSKGG